MKRIFQFLFESTKLLNHTRSFNSLSQAARENSLSRIYVSYHFRKACDDGEALGKSIGAWSAQKVLRKIEHHLKVKRDCKTFTGSLNNILNVFIPIK